MLTFLTSSRVNLVFSWFKLYLLTFIATKLIEIFGNVCLYNVGCRFLKLIKKTVHGIKTLTKMGNGTVFTH